MARALVDMYVNVARQAQSNLLPRNSEGRQYYTLTALDLLAHEAMLAIAPDGQHPVYGSAHAALAELTGVVLIHAGDDDCVWVVLDSAEAYVVRSVVSANLN